MTPLAPIKGPVPQWLALKSYDGRNHWFCELCGAWATESHMCGKTHAKKAAWADSMAPCLAIVDHAHAAASPAANFQQPPPPPPQSALPPGL